MRKKQLVALTFNSNRLPLSVPFLQRGRTDYWEIFSDTHPNVCMAHGGTGQYADMIALRCLILRNHTGGRVAAMLPAGAGRGGL